MDGRNAVRTTSQPAASGLHGSLHLRSKGSFLRHMLSFLSSIAYI